MSLEHLTDRQLEEYLKLHEEGNSKSSRFQLRKSHGQDCKFACHVVRLLCQAQMILEEHDLDLERNREHLKAIRRGDVSEQEIREWAASKEKDLERLYANSKLRTKPDEAAIKSLLLECLEHHYGILENMFQPKDELRQALIEINNTLSKVGRFLV